MPFKSQIEIGQKKTKKHCKKNSGIQIQFSPHFELPTVKNIDTKQINDIKKIIINGVTFTFTRMNTSMMWPSQNFLLYNETVIKIQVNEWINN